MLRELPFKTIGDIARHGLELHVYCSRCYASRIVATNDARWRDRLFASARFHCTGQRPATGQPCGCPGVPKIQPSTPCPLCIWEINQAQLDKPPWSGSRQGYRCPGCRGAVDWHIHGPASRPGGSPSASAANPANCQAIRLVYLIKSTRCEAYGQLAPAAGPLVQHRNKLMSSRTLAKHRLQARAHFWVWLEIKRVSLGGPPFAGF